MDIEGVIIRRLSKHTDDRGWLSELFRGDELPDELYPAMGYVSATGPGVVRGPHEHQHQSDLFCFLGTSAFRLYLWDNRKGATHYRERVTADIRTDEIVSVIVPPGVVHAYKNTGGSEGLIVNFPNRLYAGEGKRSEVDEIRYENDPDSPFVIED
jgi:dTDP-4-dehydrorhamnose 3,5-epimerase